MLKNFQVGDRVGIGAQIWACLEYDLCKDKNENYCPKLVYTYNAWYNGSEAHDGFASRIRAHEYFTFKIPDAIETTIAATLLCAGITTYSRLVRASIGAGKTWTVTSGAEAYALTHSPIKKDNCKKLGAKDVIITTDKVWSEPWKAKFDFIMTCTDVTDKFDMASYLSLLKPGGEFHMVGIPEKPLPKMSAGISTGGAPKLTGSHFGNH